jgi:hypothetical protein
MADSRYWRRLSEAAFGMDIWVQFLAFASVTAVALH